MAGEQPADLTHDERVAYYMAAALNRGGPLPETTYQAVLTAFGEQGLGEIVFLVCCFSMVSITLNAFDASVPGREEHLDEPMPRVAGERPGSPSLAKVLTSKAMAGC